MNTSGREIGPWVQVPASSPPFSSPSNAPEIVEKDQFQAGIFLRDRAWCDLGRIGGAAVVDDDRYKGSSKKGAAMGELLSVKTESLSTAVIEAAMRPVAPRRPGETIDDAGTEGAA